MSGAAAKAPGARAPKAAAKPAAKPAPRSASSPRKPRGGGKAAMAKVGASRLGRLGSWGWAAVLGTGVVTLSPIVHAFWGDVGVLGLMIFGLGFLLGRWTAV
jgi:hypothetical protein